MPISQDDLREHYSISRAPVSLVTSDATSQYGELVERSMHKPLGIHVSPSKLEQDDCRHINSSETSCTIGPHERSTYRTANESSLHRSSKPDTLVSCAPYGSAALDETDSIGQDIPRPRSALHSGDFTQQNKPFLQDKIDESSLYNPPSPSWFATSPPRNSAIFQADIRTTPPTAIQASNINSWYRAPSLSSSLSSSFAFKAPTSPLVHSESNEEIEDELIMPTSTNSIYQQSSRRHTLHSENSIPLSGISTPSGHDKLLPVPRRIRAHPYQAHQPRKSSTSTSSQTFNAVSSLNLSSLGTARRPSISNDSVVSSRTSMIGSYEESILRGRMSTAPSRPLNFLAEIGVLGLGKCKPHLRCPPHVNLTFPAVFYSYGTTLHDRGQIADEPSPYVGQIDLENDLANSAWDTAETRGPLHQNPESTFLSSAKFDTSDKLKHRKSRAPPGGSYRIPQKGQLQIIIKNPNKTAVKLYLIPYDLAGMQPGTKTFLRQRSYSTGPIIDMPLSAGTAYESNMHEIRPTLRYLIHIHICCTGRNRFYLYKSIRVVFANRVSDGKDNLHNSIQVPDPKYSPYRPERESVPFLRGNSISMDKAWRRRSSGYVIGGGSASSVAAEFHEPHFNFGSLNMSTEKEFSEDHDNAMSFPRYKDVHETNRASMAYDPNFMASHEEVVSPTLTESSSDQSRPTTARLFPESGAVDKLSDGGRWNKLEKNDIGYGGVPKRPTLNADSSLLAMEIKGLGIWKDRSPI